MMDKMILLGCAMLFAPCALALDWQREYLLGLYHDVEFKQTFIPLASVNLSAGMVLNYQSKAHDEIEFARTPPAKTQFGIFTHESLQEDIANSHAYEFTTVEQFGHSEYQSYGIYMKKRF